MDKRTKNSYALKVRVFMSVTWRAQLYLCVELCCDDEHRLWKRRK